jgi:hypothetical protein
MKIKCLDHGMLLDSTYIMDDAFPTLYDIKDLVPKRLHEELDLILKRFEHDLVECDVSERYEEKNDGK